MRAIMLAVVVALMGPSDQGTPRLEVRATPIMSLIDSNGGSLVTLYAEIKGVEDEKFYCPKVIWELGATEAVEESDCAPFEQRHECRESQVGCGWRGWKRDPVTGEIKDEINECPCTVTGYPRLWIRRLYIGPHPNGEFYEVYVRLMKNGKTISRQSARFLVRG